ncbi:hypothetical protein AB6E88_09750 [Providencia hangzhouensis]
MMQCTRFISGANATTEVPTSGQATYTIAGINQFAGEEKQTGWFNADFADKSYTGALEGVNSHSMAGAIEEDGKFSGTAIANGIHQGDSMGNSLVIMQNKWQVFSLMRITVS